MKNTHSIQHLSKAEFKIVGLIQYLHTLEAPAFYIGGCSILGPVDI